MAIKCNICLKQFTKRGNLLRHTSQIHSDENQKFICHHCNEVFTRKSSLIRHTSRKHDNNNKSPTTFTKCVVCPFKSDKKNMLDHYRLLHDIKITTCNESFSNFIEFEKWKAIMEKETTSKYVKYRTKTTKNKVVHFYRCHREGFYKSSGKNIRHLKQLGSNKINGYCPAKLDVTVIKTIGNVKVKFIKSHVGHEMDLGRLALSKTEKDDIATKLSQKIPFDEVLNCVRDGITSNSDLERIHLLTRKDLFNIESTYNLNNEAVRHSNDCASVEAWIEEIRENNDDFIVRLYKAQGETDSNFPDLEKQDFLLVIMNQAQVEILNKYGDDVICVDGTHGTNAYNFELTTLLVLDEMREGFPCMFVFSNRANLTVFKHVFTLVKNLCTDLKPKIFMSDLAEAYYNAWCDTIGPVPSRLFCSWHLDKAWRKNIKEKIKDQEKQAYAYKVVRTLMEERDKTAFNLMYPQAVIKMLNDRELKDFAKYFETYYVSNKESWAYSYRMHSGLNTNMHLERMHRTIKYIYLKGKVGKRLDKTIHAIMKFIRDKLFERIITINKGKLSSKLSNLRRNHITANQCQHQHHILEDQKGYWKITSSTGKELYHVERNISSCPCELKCLECKACIHSFLCSCPDNAIKWNMCKHIHIICLYLNQHSTLTSALVMQEDESDHNLFISIDAKKEEEEIIWREMTRSQNLKLTDKIEDVKATLQKQFTEIVSKVTNLEGAAAVQKALLPLKPLMPTFENKNLHYLPEITDKRKKCAIKPQRTFTITKKKKKKSKLTCSVPTVEEKDTIAINLLK